MTRLTAAIFLVAACLLGCGGNDPVGPGQLTISVLSGNAQSGPPGQPLSIPLTVLVTDRSGVGVLGAIVRFTVTSGAGTVSPISVGTDAQGLASGTWTLGNAAETQTVLATVFTSPESHADFSATVKAPIISIVSGNNQAGSAGIPLAAPLVIKVTTADGISMAGAAIDWTSGGALLQTSATDADGLASAGWTLGKNVGTQTATATVREYIPANVTFSATAALPVVILGYDGSAWRTVLADTSFTGVSPRAIWGASPSDVYAVGRCTNNSAGVRYDGAIWTSLSQSLCGGQPATFVSIWGNSASDIFVVGNIAPHSPTFENFISHYDGQSWSEVYSHAYTCCHGLLAVWSRARNDAVAIGDDGIILRYDGTAWNPQQPGTTVSLRGVWGPAVGPGVFVVGDAGTVLYYDGTTWGPQPTGTTSPLYAVWGTSSNDVFAVGGTATSSGTGEATILHYDGTRWTSQTIAAGILRAVWGTSNSSVFAVGDDGTILHYDGVTWTRQSITTRIDLRGVWGSSPTNVFAVGEPR